MPIMKCQADGKDGYKYGENGTCYTGSDARMKAAKQGRAIEASKHKADADILLDKLRQALIETSK